MRNESSARQPYIRLKDIAARAGVSVMTVSLALRGDSRISRSRKDEIQGLAKEMGYSANPMLSALSDYRNALRPERFFETVGLVIAHHAPSLDRDELSLASNSSAVSEHAGELGYQLDVFFAGESPESQSKVARVLRNRGIRGVIVDPVYCDITRIRLPWESLATVFLWAISKNPEKAPIYSVKSDNFLSAMRVVGKLSEKGYSRPGLFLTAQPEEPSTVEWLGGYEVGILRSKMQTHIPPLVLPGYEAAPFKKWVAKYNPDVIVGTPWIDIPKELNAMGMSVPQDIGYCGLDVGENFPHVSGIHQNRREVCRIAVDLLSSMLRRNAIGVPSSGYSITVDSVWRDAGTLRSAK